MTKKMCLKMIMILMLTPMVFGTIYVDDLTVLGPNDSFQFQIYTPSNAQKTPVVMTIYKVPDTFSLFLNGLIPSEVEEILESRKPVIRYQIPVESSWQRESFPLTFFKEVGGYLCKFSRDKKVVYVSVERTDIDGVAIDMGSFVNLEVWNSNKGKKITFGDIYTGYDQIYMGSLGDPLIKKIEKKEVKNGFIIIKTPSGNAIVHLDEQDLIKDNAVELVFLSEKPLYRPGELMNIKGYFYNRQTSSLVESGTVTMVLTDPMGIKLKEQTCHLDRWGGFEFNYNTVEESIRGHYDFTVQYNDNNYYRYLELSDYQKPEFTVEAENIRETYSIGQVPEYFVQSDYYYGQPVQSGQVHVKLDLLPDYDKSFTSKTLDIRFKNLSDGVATGTLPIMGNAIEDYSVEFTVVDQSGREVSAQKYFKYIPSNVQIQTKKWKYWHDFGQIINGVFSLKPLVETASVNDRALNFEVYRKGNLILDEVHETNNKGTVNFFFDPVLPGYYKLKIIDADYPENQIEKTFFCYSSNYTYSTNEKLEIISDKESYKPSEVMNLKLISSLHSMDLLAVFDFGSSVITKNVEVKENTADLSFVIPNDMTRNSVNMRFIGFFAGEKITFNKELPVLLERHFLDIELNTQEYVQPGDLVDYSLSLSDTEGNPLNGVVTLNVIDQSLLDLYGEDDWKEVLSSLENPPFNYYFEPFNNVYYINRNHTDNSLYETTDTLAQTKEAAYGKSVKVRSDFSDSALWRPLVVIDGEVKGNFNLPESLTTWNIRTVGFTADGRRGYTSQNFISTLPVTVNGIFPKFLISNDEVELGMNVGNYSGEDLQFELIFEGPSLKERREIHLADQKNTVEWFRYVVPDVDEKETVAFQLSALSDSQSDSMVYKIPVHPNEFIQQKGYGGIITRESIEKSIVLPVESDVTIRVSADLENELIQALEYLIDYPYGCTEQTVSSFLPSLAFINLNPDFDSEKMPAAFLKIPEITQASLKRLYSFQNYQGGWGWWKNGESDQFMTAYVLYTFYQLRKMGIDVNQQAFDRGKIALKGLLENTQKSLPFSEYVMSLLDPSHTIVLTDQESTSSKLFLSLTMMERNQNNVAHSLLEELLKEGKTVGGVFKINFDRTSYFINDVMLNALLFELMVKTGYEGEEVNALFKYLYGKKTGRFWSSTKDTAFVVMALSNYVFEDNLFDFSFSHHSTGETESLATGVIHKGNMKEYVLHFDAPATLNLSLSGSSGLLWEISINQFWEPLDENLTLNSESEAILNRSFQVKRDVSVINKDGEVSYDSLYLPIESELRLKTVVEDGAPIPEELKPVEIESFSIEETDQNSWSDLYLNHSETGIRIPEGVKLIGMDASSLTFDRNPFSYEKGKWHFFFEQNENDLVVGDEIRSTINIDLPVEYNWTALEEYLPSCFVQNESYMDNYYFGKYFSTRSYLWTYYTSNIENRYDRTSVFFDFMDEGFSVYQNHYKVISAGEFLIPPLKIFKMYEVDSDCIAPGLTIRVNPR